MGSSEKIHAEARQDHWLLHTGDFPHGNLYIAAKHIFCRKTYFLWQSLSYDIKDYCQDGVGDVPVDPSEQDGLGEEGSGDDNHLDFDSLSILK